MPLPLAIFSEEVGGEGHDLHRNEPQERRPAKAEAKAAAAELLIPAVGPPPDPAEDFGIVLR